MKAPWPFGHLGLKAASVGLAVALWMAVAGESTVERGLRVPLELQQFPEGLELQGEPPALVDVRVRGTSGVLARVGPGEIVAVLDLHGARPGRRLFQLTPEQVNVPFGVEVIQVAPASVVLEFERTMTRRLRIVPSVEGEPAPGYIVGEVITEPADVEVIGPESAVEAATEALSEPVSIAGATAPVQNDVTVGMLDSAIRVRNPRTTTVRVQIVPGPRERTFSDQPVRLRGLAGSLGARAVPSDVAVRIRGSREGVGQVRPSNVEAFVDLTTLGPGVYMLPVRVETPAAAGVVSIEPATVQVTISNDQR
ncbi:MAG: YbbR-like domain-containing protein [Vicinamibacterales bacterium]